MEQNSQSQNPNFIDGIIILAIGLVLLLFAPINISIAVTFSLVNVNWLLMNEKRQVQKYVFIGVVWIYIFYWINDREGYKPLPLNHIIVFSIISMFTALAMFIYLSKITDSRIKSFRESGKPITSVKKTKKFFIYFFLILMLGFILNKSINFAATLFGLCRVPSLQQIFAKDFEPKSGIEDSLVSPYDFGCKMFEVNTIPDEFTIPSKAKDININFTQVSYRHFVGEYYENDNDFMVYHFVWVTQEQVTEADAEKVLRLFSNNDENPEIFVEIIKAPDSKIQLATCYKYVGYICDVVVGYNHILTLITIFAYDQTSFELFEEIVNTAIIKSGERLLIIDSDLPK